MIRDKEQTDPQIFTQSLKEYFSQKDRDRIRLMTYAKVFNIEDKVQDYMEVLT
ncbi:MAG: hypothetical protein RR614_10360 [Eubacterium sp.]